MLILAETQSKQHFCSVELFLPCLLTMKIKYLDNLWWRSIWFESNRKNTKSRKIDRVIETVPKKFPLDQTGLKVV